jgi:hypothetical protein
MLGDHAAARRAEEHFLLIPCGVVLAPFGH